MDGQTVAYNMAILIRKYISSKKAIELKGIANN